MKKLPITVVLVLVLSRTTFGDGLGNFQRQAMGEWGAQNGHVLQMDPQGLALLPASGQRQSRYSVTLRVRLQEQSGEPEAGLLIHFLDPDHFLAYSVKKKQAGPFVQLRIVRKKPDISFVADQAPLAGMATDWFELRADVDGADVYGLVNGKPVLAYGFQGTPPAYNSHGKSWDPDPTEGQPGLMAYDSRAEFEGFQVAPYVKSSPMATPLKGKYDRRGKLMPRQSYSESMRLFTDWFWRSPELVDKRKAPAPLRGNPPYLLTNFVATDDRLWDVGGEFAFNHALVITGAVQYYVYTGERKYLDVARRVADWQIEHATPSDWALSYLAPSFVKFKPDGSWEGMEWGYEPDKSAYIGLALLKLHAATNDSKYQEAARRIAATLQKFQRPEGNWPFRVNARTGDIKYAYTCSQLWYVWFFERLAESTGEKQYLDVSNRAFRWMLDNPVRTNEWLGLYGDIASGARSFDQWVALETAMYLIDRRREDPTYVKKAERILDWINRALVVDYGFFPTVPGIVEQSQYRVVLTHHQLRLAEMYAKLYEATGEVGHKDLAIEIANSVTWNVISDGKIRQGFWHHAQAVPLILSFNEQFARIMGAIPETAPPQENHLLQTTGLVREVQYQAKGIRYQTVGASLDRLKLSSPPKEVRMGGKLALQLEHIRDGEDGWRYESATRVLDVRHTAGDVVIVLQ